MKSGLVSIIIPAYNTKNFLDRSIKSAINQTYRELEIIIVDDCSDDGSDMVCKDYAARDSRIIYIRNDIRLGVIGSRDKGIDVCEGEYLTFLDSDDYLEPDAIESLMRGFDNSDVDIVLGDIYYEYPDRSLLSEVRLEAGRVYRVEAYPELIIRARTFIWAKLYRTDFYRKNRINQPNMFYEDVAFVPYIVSKARAAVRIDRPVYHYIRNRAGSIVNNISTVKDLPKALEYLINLFEEDVSINDYKDVIELLAFGQVRFGILKIKSASDSDETELIRDSFVRLMDEHFPGWFNPEDISINVISSNPDAVRVIENLVLDKESISFNADTKRQAIDVRIEGDLEDDTAIWNESDRLYFALKDMVNRTK